MGYKKYSLEDRKAIRKRIKQLIVDEKILSRETLCERLTAEGFTAPDGGPLKVQTVQSQCNYLGKVARITAGYRRNPLHQRPEFVGPEPTRVKQKHSESDRDVMTDLILGANLSPEKKIAMLKGLRGAE